MFNLMALGLLRQGSSSKTGSVLVVTALLGWASFVYAACHLTDEIALLTAERNEAIAKYQRLTEAVGELDRVQAALSATRAEYNRVVELTETKAEVAAATHDSTAMSNGVEEGRARDDVSQTGSIVPLPPRRLIDLTDRLIDHLANAEESTGSRSSSSTNLSSRAKARNREPPSPGGLQQPSSDPSQPPPGLMDLPLHKRPEPLLVTQICCHHNAWRDGVTSGSLDGGLNGFDLDPVVTAV